MTLQHDHFSAFFRELWQQEPFPWQQRLAQHVCGGAWPRIIDLPTATGKTACIDIALFALATQAEYPPAERTAGRRIFFVVNRRVIVDEAHERAGRIAEKLRDAPQGSVLGEVAKALRLLTGEPDAPPLDVAILRGGIYRDNRWARSIAQPTIITSTIDQVGSRLLFRGYGVSEAARPLHAALLAHDSLLLLDEAHISQAFAQTLQSVHRYRSQAWAVQPIVTPFDVVQMTATPGSRIEDPFTLGDDDRNHPVLGRRLKAAKPVELVRAGKAKGARATEELSRALTDKARELQTAQRLTVAVIVNRVAVARKVHELLKEEVKDSAEVHLAIGRMRPIDRDDLTSAIENRVGKARQDDAELKPMYVVATQCLEVGADFDFDAMVSECASLDALRQRFGRLNRRGREIDAKGCIVIRQDQIKTEAQLEKLEKDGKSDDPIYGNALARTWNWLESNSRDIDDDKIVCFGIESMQAALEGVDLPPLLAPHGEAPVMFPAYVDAWAQTSPAPAPDPDVALFLHGPRRGEPEVQVCWRRDLPAEPDRDAWAEIVSLCPPSSPECMPVPIGVVREWFAGADTADEQRSDFLDGSQPEEFNTRGKRSPKPARAVQRTALAWRGISESRIVRSPGDIRPGDTLVLPVQAGGWSVFGHIPNADDDSPEEIDIAERAFRQSRGRAILRLTPSRLAAWPQTEATDDLRTWIEDADCEIRVPAIRKALKQTADLLPAESASENEMLRLLANGLAWQRYPYPIRGVVLTTTRLVVPRDRALPAMDDGNDETSRSTRRQLLSLRDHSQHVQQVLSQVLGSLHAGPWNDALLAAAKFHDLGKADERFQALLLNGDLTDAWAQPEIWAKSARLPASRAERAAACRRSSLPSGFRHEMLSAQLAQLTPEMSSGDAFFRELVLHLVAAHHGRARPFAPVVFDENPPDVSLPEYGIDIVADQRRQNPPHRLDSGIAERFWRLTRHLGWWGLAYLEAILRLADQRASELEDKDVFQQPATDQPQEAMQ